MEITILLLLSCLHLLEATHCDKELNYHENYGYGFDITCQDITSENEKLLRNISVYNEIKLKIENATLSNLTSEIFENVSKIKLLFIENSSLKFGQNEEIFQKLQQLEHLIIENSSFIFNANLLKTLSKLKELNLQNNGLNFIHEGTFFNLSNLEVLKLSRNRFVTLNKIPLCELHKLKTFQIDHNALGSLKNYNFICKKNYNTLNLDMNRVSVKMQSDVYKRTTDIYYNLIEMNLGYNSISELGSFDGLKKLKILNLEGNQLRILPGKVFKMMENLQKIFLNNNFLSEIPEDVFVNLQSVRLISLENNKISNIKIDGLLKLEYLNLGNNLISNKLYLNNLKLLKTLILSDNILKGDLTNLLGQFPNLETLDLSGNRLKLGETTLEKLVNLKIFSINSNYLDTIPSQAFKNSTNLEQLDISFNKLNYLNNDTFHSITNLEILNMSYNYFETLNYDLLEPLDNLQVLDMAGNRLKHLQYDSIITHLPSLRVINIKSNHLSCDLLAKIIGFFRKKQISFTINENFEYEKENVAGIYCNETRNENNTSIKLKVAFLVIFALLFILGLVLRKFYVYSKRKMYTIDEIELIED